MISVLPGISWPPAPLLAGVHRLDLRRVLLGNRLALELHRRRQLVTAGGPVALDDRELLDLLDAGELLVGGVDGLLHGLAHLLGLRELLERLARDPVLLRVDGREVGVEDDERRVVGPAVADGRGLADQWRGALDRRLDVRG